ncbi:hypothetical protein MKX07_001364 [Trichoderma sp. CBMAI-0711]|nr:hypothetical protein MKX07_001364 [Trichoderma sp. CBMAI-0711]
MPRQDPAYAPTPCALCQFHLVSGDEILIGTTQCYRRLKWNPEDEQVQLVLRKFIRISIASEARFPNLGGFKCYHAGCLDITSFEDGIPLLLFVEAMRYRRPPSLLQKETRREHLTVCLSTELSKHFAIQGTHLPLELWNQIAQHLLPLYATANARSLWKHSEPEPVCMARDIWCEHVESEGIRYVARLSNTPSNGGELIYRPSGEAMKYIFTGENHLGVMKVLISTTSDIPQIGEVPGMWWGRVHIEEGHDALRARSDVLHPVPAFRKHVPTNRPSRVSNFATYQDYLEVPWREAYLAPIR